MQNRTKEEIAYLREEFDSYAFRQKLESHYKRECVNCGNTEHVEFHHIVPLKLGGTNRISNIIPLCHQCHKAAHCGQHISKYSDKGGGGGRKPMATAEKNSDVFDMFIRGEIGNQKCSELLGYSSRTRIAERKTFKDYIKSLGIERVRNFVDISGTTCPDGIPEGKIVGEVIYMNGRRAPMFYKETGVNDVVYKQKGNSNRRIGKRTPSSNIGEKSGKTGTFGLSEYLRMGIANGF